MNPPRLKSLPAANKVFVNRDGPLRVFEQAAFAIPADNSRLLTFYGIGGQGKTALCRELMHRTCTDPSYQFLRRAELDLHGRPKTDPDLLLVWIRNGFADAGVALPCFDLALAIAWEATRSEQPSPKLTKAWLGKAKEVVGEGAAGGSKVALENLGDAVAEIPGVGFLVKKISGWVIDKGHAAYLHHTREALQELYRDGDLRKPHEISELLPWILAQDLNHYLAGHPDERFVLFVDEYERVFDEGSAGAILRENPFDRHLRTLVREANGLLAVFFSRERLPWEDDPDWAPALEGSQHLLGGLADKDADEFLRAIPIDDSDLRKAIIEGARETTAVDAPIYPLMLDLQVEHWRTLEVARKPIEPATFNVAATDFTSRRREIVARVLRDYGQPLQSTLRRLACARRFDRAAFEHIVKTYHTGLPLDAFDTIDDLSFLTKASDGYLSMHGIISDAIRQMLDVDTRIATLQVLFEHYNDRATVSSPLEVTDATIAVLFEAADVKMRLAPREYIDWLGPIVRPVYEAARYSDAATLWRQAVVTAEISFGLDSTETATSLNNLGFLLQKQSDLTSARRCYESALQIREQKLGPFHLDTAESLNNFGHILQEMGDLVAAEPYYLRALEIVEKIQGNNHEHTASCVNNLGLLFLARGDLVAAKPHFMRALAINEKVFGPDHSHTALALNNLGGLLLELRDLSPARLYFERAFSICKNTLGVDHPHTAFCLHNIGGVLLEQGEFFASRQYFERALAINLKMLGPDHHLTASSFNGIGLTLHSLGNLAEARIHYERALAIREKVLGADHLDTASSLYNLGDLLAESDRSSAKVYLEAALAICEKVLGPDHARTRMFRAKLRSLDPT
ncbi:tetratricopeptide repeat protein [Rhodopseudomonas sp. WA056]|uniref:tetratricopeptide repeat protein n=1 Tax=Rhodopseudomonas sp. WA056 TaxID=2269367 RepID=UPI0013DEFEAE|nr:tetratricopeptide repeat protein [Rhodopseudomonas sp. WA056]NEW88548.1 tetratricopeptide repeat protein [Rhodopseudomonas sp. WA056]